MDAIEYIKHNVNPVSLLEKYTNNISVSGKDIRCCCPIHKGNNSTAFVFNMANGLWYCHTQCKTGGDIIDLVMLLENKSFTDAITHIANTFNIDLTNLEIKQRTESYLKEQKQWIETMRSINKKDIFQVFDMSVLGKLYDIKHYRQFTSDTLNTFGIKYCQNNKRIVVPIFNQNKIVGVTMRRTDNHPAKWIHQPSGLCVGNILYNLDNVKQNETIIIVEGVWDVLNYWQLGYENVICTFGCKATDVQIKKIIQTTYDVVIAYDNDSAGISGTHKLINQLKKTTNVHIANIPDTKDIGELSTQEIHDSITNKLKIQEWRNKYG